jgi:hypothetical protein
MNHITAFIFTTLLLFSHVKGESLIEVKPGTEEWKQIYDPPFEKPSELGADSSLRKQLFDLLRPKVESIAKQPVKFQGSLRAFRNWALFVGRSLDEKGVSLKLPELGNDDTVALWLRTSGGWKLVDYSAGHSDAFYFIWTEQYGMPAELLKHSD